MTNAELAGKLLREAANFYRMLGEDKDAEVSERMEKFGKLYENVAVLVENDPTGEVAESIVS